MGSSLDPMGNDNESNWGKYGQRGLFNWIKTMAVLELLIKVGPRKSDKGGFLPFLKMVLLALKIILTTPLHLNLSSTISSSHSIFPAHIPAQLFHSGPQSPVSTSQPFLSNHTLKTIIIITNITRRFLIGSHTNFTITITQHLHHPIVGSSELYLPRIWINSESN